MSKVKDYDYHYPVLSATKRVFSRSPIARAVRESAKCPRKRGPKGGARYRCAGCRKDFGGAGVQVDHIDPVIPLDIKSRDMDWNTIISRIFCDTSNLQVLCKSCHKKKSKEENKARRDVNNKTVS